MGNNPYQRVWANQLNGVYYIKPMSKFLLFPAFAIFALVACSDKEKDPPNHAELCAKKPITRECLAGKWRLERVEGASDCNKNNNELSGRLELYINGTFSFEGGIYNIETYGHWTPSEDGKAMDIKCEGGDCMEDLPVDTNAEIEVTSRELKVTSKKYTSFSRCNTGSSTAKLIEVFSWERSN